MADPTRSTTSTIGYLASCVFGLVAGFALVWVLAGGEDPQSLDATTPLTSPTSTVPDIADVALSLSEVVNAEDALAVLDEAPTAPGAGVDIVIADGSQVPVVIGSTAFTASSSDLASLDTPFFATPSGDPVRLSSGPKVVVMIVFAETIIDTEGLVMAAVIDKPDGLKAVSGPFEGMSQGVTARIGRSDVIGQTATELGFREVDAPGSVRVDGPMVTFVFEPQGPFRIVIARGDDDSLNTFGSPEVSPGEPLDVADLVALGDVDALVGTLTEN